MPGACFTRMALVFGTRFLCFFVGPLLGSMAVCDGKSSWELRRLRVESYSGLGNRTSKKWRNVQARNDGPM